ncbi:MAG: radical SAM family heme chaperone HemW [Coprobacillus sp.]|nr:radical SAM family heme chaperone HemW [Coprobacillus sp.]
MANQKVRKNKDSRAHALYIHIPFCSSFCYYCDFPKTIYDYTEADAYLRALNQEFSYRINEPLNDIYTVYIGGGTPTSLTPVQLRRLFEIVKAFINTDNVQEYTVEANPESLTDEKIKLFKEYGVNRVSLGVESTDNHVLKDIGRKHTYEDVIRAVSLLKKNKFTNYNLDLILDLPKVNEVMIRKDIENILSLGATHISIYSLEVYPNTVFGKQGVEPVDSDTSYAHYKLVNDLLKKAGYIHYEVSNWSQPGYESLHNLTYWRNEKYYGLGMGAAGYIRGFRYKNNENINDYLNCHFQKEKERVNKKSKATYEVMMRLRTIEGINDAQFKANYGYSFIERYKEKIDSFVETGYLTNANGVVRPTFNGMMALNYVLYKILEEDL